MNTRLLIIIGMIITVFIMIPVHALPYISPESNFENSKHVLIGKVLSIEILSQSVVQKTENIYSEHYGFALYEIEVEKYLKNPISNSTIQILGQYTNEKNTMTYVTKPYEVEQIVLLYLQEENRIPGYNLMIRSSGSQVIDDIDNLTCKEVGCSMMIAVKPTGSANYVDFRNASGEIIEVGCSVGLRASPNDDFGTSFFEFIECIPFVSLVLLIMLPVGGIISGFIIWRKRK